MKRVAGLYTFCLIVILLPCSLGIKRPVTVIFWVYASLLLLLPAFVQLIKERALKWDRDDVVVMIFACLSALSILIFGNVTGFFSKVLRTAATVALPYFAGKYFISEKEQLLKLFLVLGLGAFVESAIAIYENYSGDYLYAHLPFQVYDSGTDFDSFMTMLGKYERVGTIRVVGSFIQPIFFGAFLMGASLLSFMSAYYFKQSRNVFTYLQIIISLAGAALTQSRTPFIAACAGLAAFSCLQLRNAVALAKHLVVVAMLLACVYIGFTLLSPGLIDDYVYANLIAPGADANLLGRQELWGEEVKAILSNTNLVGEASYSSGLEYFLFGFDHTNGFLNRFLYDGTINGAIYLYLWAAAFVGAVKWSISDDAGKIVLIFLVYLAVANFFTHLVFQNEVILALFWGIALNPALRNGPRTERRSG